MVYDMDTIRYEEYLNPYPAELDDEVFNRVAKHHGDILRDYAPPAPVAEYVLKTVRQRSGWPSEVTEWEQKAAEWIPAPVQAWWYDQAKQDPGVDDESPEWWQTQALGVVAAWHDDRPVGVVALAQIIAEDRRGRGLHSLQINSGRPLFNEIRSLVVDEQFRRSAYKIGTRLVRRIVAMSSQLAGEHASPPATIAVTDNPLAMKTFLASGGMTNPTYAEVPIHLETAKDLACWRQRQPLDRADESCDKCPRREGRAWLWATKPAALEVSRDEAR